MLRKISRACRSRRSFRLFAFLTVFAAPALADDPVFGSFTLDPARSTGGDVCAVMSLEDLGGGKFHMTAVRVAANGKTGHQDGVFAFDGGDHADGAGGSLAFLRIDPQRYVVVSKGAVRSTAMRTLSADGAVMTEIADGTDDDEAFRASRVYVRGAGSCATPTK
jgi:hypothetical protein